MQYFVCKNFTYSCANVCIAQVVRTLLQQLLSVYDIKTVSQTFRGLSVVNLGVERTEQFAIRAVHFCLSFSLRLYRVDASSGECAQVACHVVVSAFVVVHVACLIAVVAASHFVLEVSEQNFSGCPKSGCCFAIFFQRLQQPLVRTSASPLGA